MKVRWSVANNAYVVMFGDSLISIFDKRFFDTIGELRGYLKPLGLKITATREVVKAEEAPTCMIYGD